MKRTGPSFSLQKHIKNENNFSSGFYKSVYSMFPLTISSPVFTKYSLSNFFLFSKAFLKYSSPSPEYCQDSFLLAEHARGLRGETLPIHAPYYSIHEG